MLLIHPEIVLLAILLKAGYAVPYMQDYKRTISYKDYILAITSIGAGHIAGCWIQCWVQCWITGCCTEYCGTECWTRLLNAGRGY